ncbi:hypothetical protein GCM10009567_05970 [Rothia amarae]
MGVTEVEGVADDSVTELLLLAIAPLPRWEISVEEPRIREFTKTLNPITSSRRNAQIDPRTIAMIRPVDKPGLDGA